MADERKENLQLKARNAALDELIAENEDRFHDLRAKHASNLGIEYVRPETPQSAALKQLEELRANFPEQFNQVAGVALDDDSGDEEPGKPVDTGGQGPGTKVAVDGSTVTG